jgi:protein phosphatase
MNEDIPGNRITQKISRMASEAISNAPAILDGKEAKNLRESIRYFELATGDTVVAGTDKGINYKDHNEDRVIIHPPSSLIAVIDGMGGEYAGEKAAEILAGTLLSSPKDINSAVSQAKQKMADQRLGRGGAVFISARVVVEKQPGNSVNKFIEVSQLGDAKLIVIRKNGTVSFESKDESIVQFLVDDGRVTSDEALYHPRRNTVLRAVSAIEKEDAKSYPKMKVEKGDIIILMSDGISDNFTSEEIVLKKHGDNLSAQQLFIWLSDATDRRMKYSKEIIKDSGKNRSKYGFYSDGYQSEPKNDNRALVIMEIK